MNAHGPLGSANKPPDQANNTVSHTTRKAPEGLTPPPARRSPRLLWLLCLLGAAAAGYYYLFMQSADESTEHQLYQGDEAVPMRELRLDVENLAPLSRTPLKLGLTTRIPPNIARKMDRHWILLQSVAVADYSDKEAAWKTAMQAFPAGVYYTRARQGRIETGGSELRDKHGSSNVFPMSLSLYRQFEDAVTGLTPLEFAAQKDALRSQISELTQRLGPNDPDWQRMDALNQGRSLADLSWLENLQRFLGELDRVNRELSRGQPPFASREEALVAWQAFQSDGQPEISAWMSENLDAPQPLPNSETVSIPTSATPVLVLEAGGQTVYLSESQLARRMD